VELPKPVGDGGAKKATEEASGPEEQSRVQVVLREADEIPNLIKDILDWSA